MTDQTENTTQNSEENPNIDGIRSALRFPLYVLILGLGLGGVGYGVNVEWISVAGFSLGVLGGASWVLLKALYGSSITEK